MSSEPVIRARGLGKHYHLYEKPVHRLQQFLLPGLGALFRRGPRTLYREFRALENVSFEIARGETIGIVGRNGSGKSTLLQLVCGTLSPSEGEVAVVGRVAALLELGSGFNTEFTGAENIRLNAAILGMTEQQIEERFDEIVAFAEVGEFIDQSLKTYSSGMVVRLAFAVAAHADADIMIVDEALSVGDFAFQAKCMRHLRRFLEGGGTLLFVSHDINAVKSLCDRAIYLRHGRLVSDGPSEEVCERFLREMNEEAGLATSTVVEASARKVAVDRGQEVEAFRQRVAPFRKHASGVCEFVGATVTDAAGQELALVEWNQELQVHVRLRALVDVESLVVAFYLRDRLQIDLVGTNTAYEGMPIPRLAAGDEVGLVFSFTNYLRGGEYGLCLVAADKAITTGQYYDWIDLAASITTANRPGQVAWAVFNPGIAVGMRHER